MSETPREITFSEAKARARQAFDAAEHRRHDAREQNALENTCPECASLRRLAWALLDKLDHDLALSQVTGAYEATDTLKDILESAEYEALREALEG